MVGLRPALLPNPFNFKPHLLASIIPEVLALSIRKDVGFGSPTVHQSLALFDEQLLRMPKAVKGLQTYDLAPYEQL